MKQIFKIECCECRLTFNFIKSDIKKEKVIHFFREKTYCFVECPICNEDNELYTR